MQKGHGKNCFAWAVLWWILIYAGYSSLGAPFFSRSSLARSPAHPLPQAFSLPSSYCAARAPHPAPPASSEFAPGSQDIYGSCPLVYPASGPLANQTQGNLTQGGSNVGLGPAVGLNWALVSCSTGPPGAAYWVADNDNNCASVACYTADGAQCAPGAAGCPCDIVSPCQIITPATPPPCLLCPPTPCLICPAAALPPPPPPLLAAAAAAGAASASSDAAASASAAAPPPAAAQAARRLMAAAPAVPQSVGESSYDDCMHQFVSLQVVACMLPLLFLIYNGYLRSELKRRLNIASQPECCEDHYLPWLLCPLCAMCQEARTLKAVELSGAPPMAPPIMQPLLCGGGAAYGAAPPMQAAFMGQPQGYAPAGYGQQQPMAYAPGQQPMQYAPGQQYAAPQQQAAPTQYAPPPQPMQYAPGQQQAAPDAQGQYYVPPPPPPM